MLVRVFLAFQAIMLLMSVAPGDEPKQCLVTEGGIALGFRAVLFLMTAAPLIRGRPHEDLHAAAPGCFAGRRFDCGAVLSRARRFANARNVLPAALLSARCWPCLPSVRGISWRPPLSRLRLPLSLNEADEIADGY